MRLSMFDGFRPILLPRPILRQIDGFAEAFLRPPPGREIDFSEPRGEPALAAPDSLSWIIFKNPITLFIGGVAGVLLELAEPQVRDGVWQHTSFRSDPLQRLKRTGLAAMITVYGPRSTAEAMIAGVCRLHEKVVGETTEGVPYHANDPELLDWVQATAGFGFMEAYHRFVRPLGQAERDQLLQEARPAACLYGAIRAPASEVELDAFFAAHRRSLVASPIIPEFLKIMERVPALPAPARPLQHLLLKASVDILPRWVARRLELGERPRLSAPESAVVRAAAIAADRIVLPSCPAAQACLRLGLPADYLYGRRIGPGA